MFVLKRSQRNAEKSWMRLQNPSPLLKLSVTILIKRPRASASSGASAMKEIPSTNHFLPILGESPCRLVLIYLTSVSTLFIVGII